VTLLNPTNSNYH